MHTFRISCVTKEILARKPRSCDHISDAFEARKTRDRYRDTLTGTTTQSTSLLTSVSEFQRRIAVSRPAFQFRCDSLLLRSAALSILDAVTCSGLRVTLILRAVHHFQDFVLGVLVGGAVGLVVGGVAAGPDGLDVGTHGGGCLCCGFCVVLRLWMWMCCERC